MKLTGQGSVSCIKSIKSEEKGSTEIKRESMHRYPVLQNMRRVDW
jgi:hypothetical protein